MDLPDILQRCRRDEEVAWQEFNRWFGRLAKRVLGGFSALSPVEREEAEDTARVRVAVAISRDRIKGSTNGEIVNFGKTVLINSGRTAWTRRRPAEPLPVLLRDRGPAPSEAAAYQAQLDCIKRRIESWSRDNRWIFMMKLDSVSTAAITADLERVFGLFVTPEAVDVRFHRMRTELRRVCGSSES